MSPCLGSGPLASCPLPGLPTCHFPQVLLLGAHADGVLTKEGPPPSLLWRPIFQSPVPVWAALCTPPGGATDLRVCEKGALRSCTGTTPTRHLAASSRAPYMKLSVSPAGGLPPLNASVFILPPVIQCPPRVLSARPACVCQPSVRRACREPPSGLHLPSQGQQLLYS